MKPWIYALLIALSAPTILGAQADGAPSPFQLADPVVTVDSLLFRAAATLRAVLDHPGTELRYTRDGSDPTLAAPRLPAALRVTESGTIKIRAFHPELRPSETVARTLLAVRDPPAVAKAELTPAAHADYPGGGARSLIDLQKGGVNFRDSVWSGFSGADLTLELTFAEAETLTGVTVSTLADPGSWIFPPAGITVFGGNSAEERIPLGEQDWPGLAAAAPAGLRFLRVDFAPVTVRYLRVVVRHVAAIPDWHPGAGTPGWLFVDEVLLER